MSLDALERAIDELAATDPSTCADAESVVRLQTLCTRLDAFKTKSIGVFDACAGWSIVGSYGAGPWLATTCHLPGAQARAIVRRAKMLRHLPHVDEAWSKGEISAPHVDAIARLHRPSTEASLERDEDLLVRQAKKLRFAHFIRALAYWDQRADAEGSEEAAEARRARRDVFLAPSFNGLYLGQMTLDPISGAIVANELDRIASEFFEADREKARTELGRDPTPSDLCRTGAQRRADALVEMATRSATAPADGRRPAPLFTVLVGWETLGGRVCELAQGIALTPGSLVPWFDHVDLERAVFEPGGRIEVGIKARFFTGATRRAIEVRDRECTHPYCDVGAARCQADHIQEYRDGGPTVQWNGRLLCGFHNRLRNNQRPPPG